MQPHGSFGISWCMFGMSLPLLVLCFRCLVARTHPVGNPNQVVIVQIAIYLKVYSVIVTVSRINADCTTCATGYIPTPYGNCEVCTTTRKAWGSFRVALMAMIVLLVVILSLVSFSVVVSSVGNYCEAGGNVRQMMAMHRGPCEGAACRPSGCCLHVWVESAGSCFPHQILQVVGSLSTSSFSCSSSSLVGPSVNHVSFGRENEERLKQQGG